MSEQLFKLKKGGEFVGYECVSEGETPDTEEKCLNWVYSKDGKSWSLEPILHDEKCPFVTTDKNGDRVFAGDEVKVYDDVRARIEQIEHRTLLAYGLRYWDTQKNRWFHFVSSDKWRNEDIELIKDKL